MSSFLFWSNIVHSAVFLKTFISAAVNISFTFYLRFRISLPYRRTERATFILKGVWAQVCLKLLFKIPSIWANFTGFCWIFFCVFIGNFAIEIFEIFLLLVNIYYPIVVLKKKHGRVSGSCKLPTQKGLRCFQIGKGKWNSAYFRVAGLQVPYLTIR